MESPYSPAQDPAEASQKPQEPKDSHESTLPEHPAAALHNTRQPTQEELQSRKQADVMDPTAGVPFVVTATFGPDQGPGGWVMGASNIQEAFELAAAFRPDGGKSFVYQKIRGFGPTA